ncbi:hypothetical protein GGH96_005442 [Coemansia sp. RSA 1972]|nr:hypothetical protein GGH96_005442 [Coemansia sp. RSA 1972]
MYSMVACTAMTSGSAVCAYNECNTIPAPATHQLIIESKNPDKTWAMQAEERMGALLEQALSRAQQAVDTTNKLKLQVIDLTGKLADESAERAKLADELEIARGIHAAQVNYFQGMAHTWSNMLNGQTQLAAEYAEQHDRQAEDKNRIAELAEENIAQQGTITELKAKIAQLEAERATLNKCVEIAESQAKQSDAIRQMCAERADLATEICRTHAIRADRAETLLELISRRIKETEALAAEQNKSTGELNQPADQADSELIVETVESQNNHVDSKLEQPTDKQIDSELAAETVESQNNQVDGPEQPTENQTNGELAAKVAEDRDKAIKQQQQPADKQIDSELADETAKCQDKATKQPVLCSHVEAVTKNANFFKATVGKVAELFRAHQRKYRRSPPKPESNSNKYSKKRMSFFEHIGQSATLCTIATAHNSAGSRF